MKNSDFQLQGVGDPRLAAHAASPLPAWLWSVDGAEIVWANPVGARIFGAANGAELAKKAFGPADRHRRQIARLAATLPPNGAMRLERLRGFGASLGSLQTCGCARLEFPDGGHAVLVVATQAPGRTMPLVERLQRLVEGITLPAVAFTQDGLLVAASEAARSLPLGFRDLSEEGFEGARTDALRQGRAELPLGIGHLVLQRVGAGADIGLVALIAPGATSAAHLARHVAPAAPSVRLSIRLGDAALDAHDVPAAPVQTLPDYELPAVSGEAPAEFALVDEFAEPSEALAPELPADVPSASEASEPDDAREPSPYVERVADEPATDDPPSCADAREADVTSEEMIATMAAHDTPTTPHLQPLRFIWQMDADGRFVLGSDEFMRLIGSRTGARFGRHWREIAASFNLDPEDRITKAIDRRNTFAAIALNWPVDGGERLPVELSGIPVYDRTGDFAGFKGFGLCRDLDGLNRLEALRRFELFGEIAAPRALSADIVLDGTGQNEPGPAGPVEAPAVEPAAPAETVAEAGPPQSNPEEPVDTPQNVVPFRPLSDGRSLTLTPVENSAFNELARRLSERLEREPDVPAPTPAPAHETEIAAEPPPPAPEPPLSPPEWMQEGEPPARGTSQRDRALLDLVPTGILIYRLDRLLYANAAFLSRMGYSSLHALEDAGGLDALYVEPGVSLASSTSQAGTPVTIAANLAGEAQAGSAPTEARLHTISWDGDSALALICAPGEAAIAPAPAAAQPPPPAAPVAGHAHAEDLAAILDTTAEGVVMFDGQGSIHACNRSAEALFGYDGDELARLKLADLFVPESQRLVHDYFESIKSQGIASLLDPGREALGRESKGGIIPLSMTMGRTRPDGPNFFAVFRDLSQTMKGEDEMKRTEQLTERAASAKADMLARISHELRMPLNAIIGFAEVMIGERFGALGNERYAEYMKDIRASGQRVISLIDDLLELSRIETGKLDLVFAEQNLNDLVERCVTVMQPQANRERIIIRTSLAHTLLPVIADGRALRQITTNLIGTSIHLAGAGGQVIVSTALTDRGEVALRVRDTGLGLSDKEVAAALEPFRTLPPADRGSDSTGFSLSLTGALAEANRAQFNIKSLPQSGTLIEVVFSPTLART